MAPAANPTSAPPADRVLVLTREFDAPRELVFEAWSSPEHMAHWFGPTDFTLPFCKMDFRVGGRYALTMLSPSGKEYQVHGVYREIVAPQRIAFTWERDGEDDEHAGHTLITITLESRGPRRTLLTLHQATFDTTEIRDGHAGGWTQAFARLDEYVEELRIERDRIMTQVSEPATKTRDARPEYASPGVATASPIPKPGKAAFVAGWIITTIIILWMGVLGIVIQLFKPEIVQKGMADHGYPPNVGLPIFVVELVCLLLYAIPRTAVLGAILLTGYLGGAVATHVRVGEAWFAPVIFGVLVWLGIYLREPRVRDLAPIRRV